MAVSALRDNVRIITIQERYPKLFERLPEKLFGPLASANRVRYWALLCALHAKRFGPDAPMPPSAGIPVSDIQKDIAEELSVQDAWESEEGVQPETPLAIRAAGVFYRLRDTGWLRVEKYGVREMVNVAPAVAQFMSRLVDFAQTGPVFVSGKVRSIEANLKLVLEGNADGSSIQEAAIQVRNLLEHVRNTGTNVRDLMAEIGTEPTTGRFVQRFFTDFVERVFIGDYRELRTRDHPLARRQEILQTVRTLQSSPSLRTSLIAWYSDKRAAGNAARGEALFERDLEKIGELTKIDEYLERLDDEIRKANKRALAFLDYRLRSLRPLDDLIRHAIANVTSHPTDTIDSPFAPGDGVSPTRLAEPRVEHVRARAGALRTQVMSPEEEARARLMLKAKERRMISSAKLSAFAIRQLGETRGVSTAAIEAKSIEDIRALQALSVVAMSNASGSSLLKGNAASLVHGFRVNRSQEPVEELHGFSHLGFDITKPEKKKPTGG
jgi:hypothetical protein